MASSSKVAASSGIVVASSGTVEASSGIVAANNGKVTASSGIVAASSGIVALLELRGKRLTTYARSKGYEAKTISQPLSWRQDMIQRLSR